MNLNYNPWEMKFSSSTEFEFNTSCGIRGEGESGGGWGS